MYNLVSIYFMDEYSVIESNNAYNYINKFK